jgi:glycosyltransferase involved in cell wall biosynthesis
MKILELSVHYSPNVGGVETHLADLVTELTKSQNNVFVLTYRPLVAKVPWKFFEKKQHLKILRLPWPSGFFYKLVSHPALEFLYLVPGLFVATPFALIISGYDVIHAHGLVAGFIGVFWAKIFNKKIIVSTHSIYHFPQKGVYALFVKWIFKNADNVLCLSDQSAQEVKALGVSPERVKRFTYWIDTEYFHPRDKNSAKKTLDWLGKFVVLFVGRLIAEKGIRELLEASRQLPDSVMVTIIGEGPLKEEIENAAKNSLKIKFIGKIDNNKLSDYYAGADVVIIPSTHEEGFGRVILEALSCGIPVIGANIGGIPEAMNEAVGILIDVTPKNIVQGILKLQTNKALYKKLSQNARRFAREKYSEKNISEIISAYK